MGRHPVKGGVPAGRGQRAAQLPGGENYWGGWDPAR
jgi:hypothetical protein